MGNGKVEDLLSIDFGENLGVVVCLRRGVMLMMCDVGKRPRIISGGQSIIMKNHARRRRSGKERKRGEEAETIARAILIRQLTRTKTLRDGESVREEEDDEGSRKVEMSLKKKTGQKEKAVGDIRATSL